MKILVISLVTPAGKARRQDLNYCFTWIRGCVGRTVKRLVRRRMRPFYGEKRGDRDGRIGCFA